MLPTIKINSFLKACGYMLLLCAFFYSYSALAASGPPGSNITTLSAQNMIVNIAKQMPVLMRMVTAIAYVMGMYFIFFGVYKLKQYGESRSMMSQEHQLKGPMVYMIVGAFLLYFPTTVEIGLSTFWNNPNPYGYLEYKDQWGDFIKTCFVIVQFVGVIAFIRGLVLMTQMAGHAQAGTLGRALAHIIGGIFCVNIYQFIQVVLTTLGVQT